MSYKIVLEKRARKFIEKQSKPEKLPLSPLLWKGKNDKVFTM